MFLAPVLGAAYEISDNFDILLNAKYMLGFNGGGQDLSYTILGFPPEKINAEASTFVNVNLGVSYKFGK